METSCKIEQKCPENQNNRQPPVVTYSRIAGKSGDDCIINNGWGILSKALADTYFANMQKQHACCIHYPHQASAS